MTRCTVCTHIAGVHTSAGCFGGGCKCRAFTDPKAIMPQSWAERYQSAAIRLLALSIEQRHYGSLGVSVLAADWAHQLLGAAELARYLEV